MKAPVLGGREGRTEGGRGDGGGREGGGRTGGGREEGGHIYRKEGGGQEMAERGPHPLPFCNNGHCAFWTVVNRQRLPGTTWLPSTSQLRDKANPREGKPILSFPESGGRASPSPLGWEGSQVSLTPTDTLDVQVTPTGMRHHHPAGPRGRAKGCPTLALLPPTAHVPREGGAVGSRKGFHHISRRGAQTPSRDPGLFAAGQDLPEP